MSSLLVCLACVNVNPELLRTWNAVCWVESKGDPYAINKVEDAVGIGQIRPIMVREVNRIKGREAFALADRLDPAKSFAMFQTYSLHHCPNGGPEQWARCWNGGPTGYQKVATERYWEKVERVMREGR